jgi:hypothetical protein
MSLDQFTLEGAQKGKELITRDGRPARFIASITGTNEQFPVVVEVFQYTEEEVKEELEEMEGQTSEEKKRKKLLSDNSNWHMQNFTVDGEYLPPFEQPEDLFIKTL